MSDEKTQVAYVRATAAQVALWQAAAGQDGRSLADWARRVLSAAAQDAGFSIRRKRRSIFSSTDPNETG